MIKQVIVSYEKFVEEYLNQLKTPSCLPRHVGELCGGWTAETFKQIIQKITKKNTAPLQLWFDSYQSMDIISTKRASLKEVFKILDTRNISRIDSCELFSVMTFIAKGDYETTITNISLVFGFKNPQCLTKDEFFFFLDSFFRGISKILLLKNKKDYTEQDVNKRLNSEDIKEITDKVYGNKINFTNKDFAREFMKSKYNQFFEYIYQQLQSSNDFERSVSLQNIQIAQEVRKCIMDVLKSVEKNVNGDVKK
ncbi:hypothetical protein ABPG74_009703 [Tetrahymena malaccensis]